MTEQSWSRRGEFVNTILILAATYRDFGWSDIVLDGVAGQQFDKAVAEAMVATAGGEAQRDAYVNTALAFGAPVEGLAADGTFGEKWAQVVALAKVTDAENDSGGAAEPESGGGANAPAETEGATATETEGSLASAEGDPVAEDDGGVAAQPEPEGDLVPAPVAEGDPVVAPAGEDEVVVATT